MQRHRAGRIRGNDLAQRRVAVAGAAVAELHVSDKRDSGTDETLLRAIAASDIPSPSNNESEHLLELETL